MPGGCGGRGGLLRLRSCAGRASPVPAGPRSRPRGAGAPVGPVLEALSLSLSRKSQSQLTVHTRLGLRPCLCGSPRSAVRSAGPPSRRGVRGRPRVARCHCVSPRVVAVALCPLKSSSQKTRGRFTRSHPWLPPEQRRAHPDAGSVAACVSHAELPVPLGAQGRFCSLRAGDRKLLGL